MTPVPLRPRLASLLASEHANAATRLRAQAADQRARAARESDPVMRDAQEAGAAMVDAWAEAEERAARRWQETT